MKSRPAAGAIRSETDAPVAEAPAASVPVTRAQFLNLFAAVFLPMFMAAVDQTLLATATPAIAGSLGGLRDTSWIMVAYLPAAAARCCSSRSVSSRWARSRAAWRNRCRSSLPGACFKGWAAGG